MDIDPIEEPNDEEIEDALTHARRLMIGSDLVAIGQGPETIANSITLLTTVKEMIGDVAMLLHRLGDNPKIVNEMAKCLDEMADRLERALPANVDEIDKQ